MNLSEFNIFKSWSEDGYYADNSRNRKRGVANQPYPHKVNEPADEDVKSSSNQKFTGELTSSQFREKSFDVNRVKIVDKKIIDVSSFRNELDETSFRQARTIQKFFEENLKKDMPTSEKAGFVRNVLEFSKRHGDKARAYLNSMLTLNGFMRISDSSIERKTASGAPIVKYENDSPEGDTAFKGFLEASNFKANEYSEAYIRKVSGSVRRELTEANGDISGLSPKVKEVVEEFDRYFETSKGCPVNLVLSRYLNSRNGSINKFANLKVGDTFTDPSYCSFTLSSSSVGVEPDFKITLYVKKGQQVLPISDGMYSETEFITNRMSKFKVFDKGFSSISVIIPE